MLLPPLGGGGGSFSPEGNCNIQRAPRSYLSSRCLRSARARGPVSLTPVVLARGAPVQRKTFRGESTPLDRCPRASGAHLALHGREDTCLPLSSRAGGTPAHAGGVPGNTRCPRARGAPCVAHPEPRRRPVVLARAGRTSVHAVGPSHARRCPCARGASGPPHSPGALHPVVLARGAHSGDCDGQAETHPLSSRAGRTIKHERIEGRPDRCPRAGRTGFSSRGPG